MPLNVDKCPHLGPPEVKGQAAEPEIQVVSYDEEQPPEAQAVPINEYKPPESSPQPGTQSTTGHSGAAIMGDDEGCDCTACGDVKIRKLSPGCHLSLSLCGDTYIDLLNDRMVPGTKITLWDIRLCGNTQLLVPRGTRVVVRRFMLCGSRDIRVAEDPYLDPAQAPRLTITILSLCGDVRASSDPNDLSRWFCNLS